MQEKLIESKEISLAALKTVELNSDPIQRLNIDKDLTSVPMPAGKSIISFRQRMGTDTNVSLMPRKL